MNGASLVGQQAPRILVVDDERRNRELIEVMLAGEGFTIQEAPSGEAALLLVDQQLPDLILLDIMMPGMDGTEFVTRMKGRLSTKNIPIIMVSALDNRDTRMLALNAGAEDFLTKPVDRAELCVRVRNLLRLKAYGEYYDRYSQMLEGEVVARTAEIVERTKSLEEHATALQRSEERTKYALDAARMGVWEVDCVTRTVTCSESMGPMFGLPVDQIPRTAGEFLDLIHPDDRHLVENFDPLTALDGATIDVEFRTAWPDGSLHWSATRARVVHGPAEGAIRLLGVHMDISDRKSLEAQFRQAQKMEAIGQLAGGVAHDFNNILTTILGYSNLVTDSMSLDDPRRADMHEVVKAGQRAAELTTQLLAFSRKQVLQPTNVDLNVLVSDMQRMLSRLIGEHVELAPILASGLGAVRADRGQLEQVLMNMVVNARDAMPSGGRLSIETANVELDGSFLGDVEILPGRYVMLAVSDDGIGMSEATRQHIFEPFFTTKQQGKGTGLGLATVYGIVKQSGGHIWVYSEPGKGATFKLYLPRVGPASVLDVVPIRPSGVIAGTEKLLLVEDDAAVRALTRTILERLGYQVFDAPDPRAAEVVFAEHGGKFSLLVTDVIMPGMSGPKLYERLVLRNPDLRVVYVSGYTDDGIVRQGEMESHLDFLQKPFTADALGLRVRAVLDQKSESVSGPQLALA